MIRAAFLRRMGMAALATILFEVMVPEVESEPDTDGWHGTVKFQGHPEEFRYRMDGEVMTIDRPLSHPEWDGRTKLLLRLP